MDGTFLEPRPPRFSQVLCRTPGQKRDPYSTMWLIVKVETEGVWRFDGFEGLGHVCFQNEFSLGDLVPGSWGAVWDAPTLDRTQESQRMDSTQSEDSYPKLLGSTCLTGLIWKFLMHWTREREADIAPGFSIPCMGGSHAWGTLDETV